MIYYIVLYHIIAYCAKVINLSTLVWAFATARVKHAGRNGRQSMSHHMQQYHITSYLTVKISVSVGVCKTWFVLIWNYYVIKPCCCAELNETSRGDVGRPSCGCPPF